MHKNISLFIAISVLYMFYAYTTEQHQQTYSLSRTSYQQPPSYDPVPTLIECVLAQWGNILYSSLYTQNELPLIMHLDCYPTIKKVEAKRQKLRKLMLQMGFYDPIPAVALKNTSALLLVAHAYTYQPEYTSEKITWAALLRWIHSPYISAPGQSSIPSHLTGHIVRVKHLSLIDGTITDISPLLYLTQLEHLNLYKNNIEQVPDIIGVLSSLQSLILSENKIKTVSNSIAKLTRLISLKIADNQLTTLPVDLGTLPLQVLDISNNAFRTFPTHTIKQLRHLQHFSYQSNGLYYIPDLSIHPHLLRVHFSYNKITHLPQWVIKIKPKYDLKNNILTVAWNSRLSTCTIDLRYQKR